MIKNNRGQVQVIVLILIIIIIAALAGWFNTGSIISPNEIQSTSLQLVSQDSQSYTYQYSFTTRPKGSECQGEATPSTFIVDHTSGNPNNNNLKMPSDIQTGNSVTTTQVTFQGIQALGFPCSTKTATYNQDQLFLNNSMATCTPYQNQYGFLDFNCKFSVDAGVTFPTSGTPLEYIGLSGGSATIKVPKVGVNLNSPTQYTQTTTTPMQQAAATVNQVDKNIQQQNQTFAQQVNSFFANIFDKIKQFLHIK